MVPAAPHSGRTAVQPDAPTLTVGPTSSLVTFPVARLVFVLGPDPEARARRAQAAHAIGYVSRSSRLSARTSSLREAAIAPAGRRSRVARTGSNATLESRHRGSGETRGGGGQAQRGTLEGGPASTTHGIREEASMTAPSSEPSTGPEEPTPPSLRCLQGDGLTADAAAWSDIADAVHRALATPNLTKGTAARLSRLRLACQAAAVRPPRRSPLEASD